MTHLFFSRLDDEFILHASPVMTQQDGLNFISSRPQDRSFIPTSEIAPRISDVVDKLLTNPSCFTTNGKAKNIFLKYSGKVCFPLRRKEVVYDIARIKINNLIKDPDFELLVAK